MSLKTTFFVPLSKQIRLWQACTTYGPQATWGPPKLFLRPARAFSIAENVAKARPRISNCCYRISSILQWNLYIEMKETSAARGKFMVIIWPFELSELCRSGLWYHQSHFSLFRPFLYFGLIESRRHGRRKGGRGNKAPLDLKILAKKVVFLFSGEKKQIMPLLSPPKKLLENPLVVPPGKNPSDAHAHSEVWKNQFLSACNIYCNRQHYLQSNSKIWKDAFITIFNCDMNAKDFHDAINLRCTM